MHDLGRMLLFFGLVLVVAGVLILGLGQLRMPLARLPGDLRWHGRGWSISFPLATSILISILLSFLFWVVGRLRR